MARVGSSPGDDDEHPATIAASTVADPHNIPIRIHPVSRPAASSGNAHAHSVVGSSSHRRGRLARRQHSAVRRGTAVSPGGWRRGPPMDRDCSLPRSALLQRRWGARRGEWRRARLRRRIKISRVRARRYRCRDHRCRDHRCRPRRRRFRPAAATRARSDGRRRHHRSRSTPTPLLVPRGDRHAGHPGCDGVHGRPLARGDRRSADGGQRPQRDGSRITLPTPSAREWNCSYASGPALKAR